MTTRFFKDIPKLCERAYHMDDGSVDPNEPVVHYRIRAIEGCGNGRFALDVYVRWPDWLEATEQDDIEEKAAGRISLFAIWMPEAVLVLHEEPL